MRETTKEALKPPPNLTVSEWADLERYLSAESSAEPGKWSTKRAEYQRGIMDAVSDDDNEEVIIMSSAQVGKTEIVNNVLGFHIDQDPSPVLLLQPTIEMGQAYSKDRLAPMLRDSPALTGKVKDPASRNSGNTLLHKSFPGGHITIAGANSPASLASRPIRVLLGDEIDRYPASAGTEGDPVTLARKRTLTFSNRKIVLVSTPTDKGASRIEKAYGQTDKRRYFVPCPHCGECQIMAWANVVWLDDDPSTAAYACGHCGAAWSDAERWAAIKWGEWRATAKAKKPGAVGFQISALYSPWARLSSLVAEFLEADAGGKELLKAWINTVLGETWDTDGERFDWEVLSKRREPYGLESLPAAIRVITAGVDIQDDRIEIEFAGWAEGRESWGLHYQVIYGNPAKPETWAQVDAALKRVFTLENGRKLRVSAACVDSGGHHTDAVYKFTGPRLGRRVYAIKGQAGKKPIWNPKAGKTKFMTPLFHVGVDTAKEALYGAFKLTEPGPGYCHFPADYPDSWFMGATAEQIKTRSVRGFVIREWVKIRERNEPLDMRVYATAALESLAPDWDALNTAAHAWDVANGNADREPEPPEPPDESVTERIVKHKLKQLQRHGASSAAGYATRWRGQTHRKF